MSDYLSNLVTKNLGLAEVVEPRPVLLFESPPMDDGPIPPHPFGVDPVANNGDPMATAFEAPAPAQPPIERPTVVSPPAIPLRPPSEPGQEQPGDLSATSGRWLWQPTEDKPTPPAPQPTRMGPEPAVSQPETRPAPPIDLPSPGPPVMPERAPLRAEKASRPARVELAQPPGDPAPGPVRPTRPLTPEPLPPPPGWRRQPFLDRPRQALGDNGRERNAAPPRLATELNQRPVLEPAVREIVIERTTWLAAPTPTKAVGAEADGVAPRSTAERRSHGALGPAASRLEPSSIPSTPSAVITRPQVVPLQRVEPVVPALAKPVLTAEPPATIQVTIGRIEVRATPPASPPKARPARAPVMSLDEYLRQRAKGEGK